jgi:hypothetical protein
MGKYYVDMSKDGPGLELHLPPCYEREGVAQLAPGSLWHQRRTKNTSTNLWEPASEELIEGFKEVRDLIRQHLIEMKPNSTAILIGAGAKRLLDNGQAILHGVEE